MQSSRIRRRSADDPAATHLSSTDVFTSLPRLEKEQCDVQRIDQPDSSLLRGEHLPEKKSLPGYRHQTRWRLQESRASGHARSAHLHPARACPLRSALAQARTRRSARAQQAWKRFFSRKWLPKDSIVPEFEPQVGISHNLKKQPKRQTDGSYLGGVWSGAAANTGTWSNIIGYWTVPTVSKPNEPQGQEGGWNSSSWLGLDGFSTSDDVLQAGIQQRVSANGVASYVAWFEWYAPQQPNSPPYIWQTDIPNFPVAPGQQIYCSVAYNGHTSGSISLANETTGKHFAITLAPPPGATFNGSSYEWVMEAPDGGEPISALPKFTPVTFTTALACNAGLTATGNPAVADTLNIETTGGKILTSVSVGTDTATIKFVG
jgi:hypothetical protein